VNNPHEEGAGFGTLTNKVTILFGKGGEKMELLFFPSTKLPRRY